MASSSVSNNPILIANQLNYFRQQEQQFQQEQNNMQYGSNVNRLRSVFFTQQNAGNVNNEVNLPPPVPPKHFSRGPSTKINNQNVDQPPTDHQNNRSRSLSTPRSTTNNNPSNKPEPTDNKNQSPSTDHFTRFQSAKALFARMEEESAKQRQSLIDTHIQMPPHKRSQHSSNHQPPASRRSLSHNPTPKNYTIINSNDTKPALPEKKPMQQNEISTNIVSTKRLLFQNERTDGVEPIPISGYHSSSSSLSSSTTPPGKPNQSKTAIEEISPTWTTTESKQKRSWSKLGNF